MVDLAGNANSAPITASATKHTCIKGSGPEWYISSISRVPDQNVVSRLYNMLEIHHSGREPTILYTEPGICRRNEDSHRNEYRKSRKNIFSLGGKNRQAYFFSYENEDAGSVNAN